MQGAVSNNGGPLYDDGTLQIASKLEVIGSQVCMLVIDLYISISLYG